MTTWHLVEQQGEGIEHTHAIILTEDEARESLALEASIHSAARWTVLPILNAHGQLEAVRLTKKRAKGDVVRTIMAREFEHPVPGAVYPHEC